MCQYNSQDGAPNEWHYLSFKNLILSGVGSIVMSQLQYQSGKFQIKTYVYIIINILI